MATILFHWFFIKVHRDTNKIKQNSINLQVATKVGESFWVMHPQQYYERDCPSFLLVNTSVEVFVIDANSC